MYAQQTPIQVAAKQAILDERGQPLSNADGDLVQFLLVNGQVHAPSVDGLPHSTNVVLFTSRIGNGVAQAPSTLGRFNAALTPVPGAAIVARVFNAPSLEAASFYADSQTFTPNGQTKFYPVFGATTNALDPADDDGDGVHNSWEKSLGSNRLLVDSDGDGMGDGDEFRAGTGLADGQSFLAMVQVMPQAGGAMRATWDAVPGKVYQLQVAGDLTEALSGVFQDVNGAITADADEVSTVLTNGAALPSGFFRVRLMD